MAKKNPYEGYVTAREAAAAIRAWASDMERNDTGDLVKYSINVWFKRQPAELEQRTQPAMTDV